MIRWQELSTALYALSKAKGYTATVLLTTLWSVWSIIRKPAIFALQGR